MSKNDYVNAYAQMFYTIQHTQKKVNKRANNKKHNLLIEAKKRQVKKRLILEDSTEDVQIKFECVFIPAAGKDDQGNPIAIGTDKIGDVRTSFLNGIFGSGDWKNQQPEDKDKLLELIKTFPDVKNKMQQAKQNTRYLCLSRLIKKDAEFPMFVYFDFVKGSAPESLAIITNNEGKVDSRFASQFSIEKFERDASSTLSDIPLIGGAFKSGAVMDFVCEPVKVGAKGIIGAYNWIFGGSDDDEKATPEEKQARNEKLQKEILNIVKSVNKQYKKQLQKLKDADGELFGKATRINEIYQQSKQDTQKMMNQLASLANIQDFNLKDLKTANKNLNLIKQDLSKFINDCASKGTAIQVQKLASDPDSMSGFSKDQQKNALKEFGNNIQFKKSCKKLGFRTKEQQGGLAALFSKIFKSLFALFGGGSSQKKAADSNSIKEVMRAIENIKLKPGRYPVFFGDTSDLTQKLSDDEIRQKFEAMHK